MAGRVATLLEEQFGATRVVVFGSLVHKGCFTRWSDVDIAAAWGISPDDTLRAIGAAACRHPEDQDLYMDSAALNLHDFY